VALFIGSARETPTKYERAEAATHEMADLFRALIAARRAAPQRDLLSELVHLEDEGDRLSEDELVATCVLLLFAGHETTTHHIANGHPRAYPQPDRVDLERHGVPHLTFGYGTHICLGFPLARLEGQIALPAVLARWRHIEPAQERLEWMDSMVLRGMKAFPIRVS